MSAIILGVTAAQLAYAWFAVWCVAQLYGWPIAIALYGVMFAIGFSKTLAERQS